MRVELLFRSNSIPLTSDSSLSLSDSQEDRRPVASSLKVGDVRSLKLFRVVEQAGKDVESQLHCQGPGAAVQRPARESMRASAAEKALSWAYPESRFAEDSMEVFASLDLTCD